MVGSVIAVEEEEEVAVVVVEGSVGAVASNQFAI